MTVVSSTPAIGPFSATSNDFTAYATARHWIGGAWRDPLSSKTELDVVNPRYGKTIAQVRIGGADDVAAAVKSGAAAARYRILNEDYDSFEGCCSSGCWSGGEGQGEEYEREREREWGE